MTPKMNKEKISQTAKFLPGAHFKTLTPFYDLLGEILGLGRRYRKAVSSALNLPNKKLNILDAGCGTGSLAIDFKKQKPNLNIYAIDADKDMLKIAAEKAEKEKAKIIFNMSLIQNLPFPDSYFDIVYSSLVFHHLPGKVKKEAVKEIHRVLKKGGKFFLADFGKANNLFEAIFPLFALLFEEGYDNYKGNLPAILKERFPIIKEIGRYKMGIIFLLAGK